MGSPATFRLRYPSHSSLSHPQFFIVPYPNSMIVATSVPFLYFAMSLPRQQSEAHHSPLPFRRFLSRAVLQTVAGEQQHCVEAAQPPSLLLHPNLSCCSTFLFTSFGLYLFFYPSPIFFCSFGLY